MIVSALYYRYIAFTTDVCKLVEDSVKLDPAVKSLKLYYDDWIKALTGGQLCLHEFQLRLSPSTNLQTSV